MRQRYGFVACIVLPCIACSSSDGDPGPSNDVLPPPMPTTSTPIIIPGGNGGGSQNEGPRDGGTQPLTPEQVTALETSSCAGWKTEVESLPALLQLVVDVSGSMNEEAPGPGDESKWELTREALRDALDGLPDTTGVGVLYYPNRDTSRSSRPREITACVRTNELIPMALLGAPGSSHRDQIDASLNRVRPNGATPTHDAFYYAFENGLEPSTLPGNRFMLLITDGAPTLARECVGDGRTPVDTDPIIAEIQRARDEGVRTFIIGSPGSEVSLGGSNEDARPWLSRAAMVGGTAKDGCTENGPNFCHFDMTQVSDFGAALRDGLAQIAGQIVSCVYDIPPPPSGQSINREAINVVVSSSSGDAQLVLRDDMGDCTEGWKLENDQVVLCEATCNRAKSDESARVQLLFGCTSNQVPIVE